MDLFDFNSLLADEWGTKLGTPHFSAREDDLTGLDHLFIDSTVPKPVDVEEFLNSPPSQDNDCLGLEWMENSELGRFLDGDMQLDSSVLGPVPTDRAMEVEDHKSLGNLLLLQELLKPVEPVVHKELVHGLAESTHNMPVAPSSPLSTPSSPEQVAPSLPCSPELAHKEVTSVDVMDSWTPSTIDTSVLVTSDSFDLGASILGSDGDLSQITDLDLTEIEPFSFGGSPDPSSIEDVDSHFSTSEPSSPFGSPAVEHRGLYKVVATSSVDQSRSSPYSRTPARKSKTRRCRVKEDSSEDLVVPTEMNIGVLTKKDRKRLQNKNAAIRYRMKKKEEAKGVVGEEQELEKKNKELKDKVDQLQREIKYMKDLMNDINKARCNRTV